MNNPIDIVSLISNSAITKLSKPYQNKLINKIKHSFDNEEQQLFVASFYCYLNFDSTKDFVIDLDNIWQWVGFSRKDHAKRIIENNFKVGVDYIIALPRTGERKNEGGFNKETIMLSVKTFKAFCLKARTDKASQVHDYYIKLEEILHELLDEETSELRDQLQATQTLLKNTENALSIEKEKYKSALRRKYYKEEPGDIIYVYANDMKQEKPMLKIGKTTNISERENQFNTCNLNGEILYTKRCYNCDLLERVIHHVLDKHRVYNKKEWFDIPLSVAKQVVDTCHLILDQLIPHVDDLPTVNFFGNLQNMLTSLENINTTTNPPMKENVKKENLNMYEILDKQKNEEINQIIQNTNINIEGEDIINPLDFDRFVQEACDVGEDYYCLKVDIYGAHKIWSRNIESITKKKTFKYFQDRFKSDKIYFEEHQAVLAVWRGIRPKPLVFAPKDPSNPTKHEKFIMERCKLGFTYRAPFKIFCNEFEDWMKSNDDSFNLSIDERRNLQQYLSTTFLPSAVYVSTDLKDIPGGGANKHGVWGITVKSDNTHVGVKLSNRLRKRVVSIDVSTQKVVKVYQSGVEAARDLNIIGSNVSQLIKFKRVRNGLMLRFVQDDDDLPSDENDE
jgi:phage anti-repressor protein